MFKTNLFSLTARNAQAKSFASRGFLTPGLKAQRRQSQGREHHLHPVPACTGSTKHPFSQSNTTVLLQTKDTEQPGGSGPPAEERAEGLEHVRAEKYKTPLDG